MLRHFEDTFAALRENHLISERRKPTIFLAAVTPPGKIALRFFRSVRFEGEQFAWSFLLLIPTKKLPGQRKHTSSALPLPFLRYEMPSQKD